MELVQEVESFLSAEGKAFDLLKLADQCYDLGSFPALWAVEGLGHFYGETVYEKGKIPRELLTCPEARHLPSKSLTMLHAGIGLSLAKHALGNISKKTSESELRSVLEDFLELCRDSSRTGYMGAAIESLGLVSRFLHGASMVRRIDLQLRQVESGFRGYLWHGAGRAVYFSPQNFIPGVSSPWRGIAMCRAEAIDELALSNMIGGFGWAVTLVNMRTPEVMESLLRHHGEFLSVENGFSNGVASSIIMRYDTSPEDRYIEPFKRYQPQDSAMAELWTSLVGAPCRAALEDYYPALKQSGGLEEVFRFRSLSKLG
jgi:hypothetical protein